MWGRLHLKARLMLLFALLLVAGMMVSVALALQDARPRVAAEDESSVRLAVDFIQSAAPALDAAPDSLRALRSLVRSLQNMRHVRISLHGIPGEADTPEDAEPEPDVPGWFVRLISPREHATDISIVSDGRQVATIRVAAEPLDEIAEIWDGMLAQLATDAVLAAVVLAITFITVGRALAPIADLSRAIRLIGEGRYDTHIQPSGPPELADICRQMNGLATVLGSTVEEKRRLAEHIVTLQDDERRDLARELHDEFGPHLFAIRAQVAALARGAAIAESQPLADAARAIGEQVDALQASNRRVLGNLRPVALDELGLEPALTALVDRLRESRPELEVAFACDAALEHPEGSLRLTIYRVVQESLTNVLRHADATQVQITIDSVGDGNLLRIRVSDNGIGMPDPAPDGFGLRGMKERVAALGGQLDLQSLSGGGTVVEAVIPAVSRDARATPK